MRQSDASAFSRFDQLPEAANVRISVVCALFSISPATVWRWCKSGKLPTPRHMGGVTFWNVGELRAVVGPRRPKNAEAGLVVEAGRNVETAVDQDREADPS